MRCIFTEGGVKCGDRIIPASKYCRKHILEDKKQVLFRACNIEKAGVICKEPVPTIFEDTTCTLHIQLPPQRNYAQKKYESDTDDETTPEPSLSNIKKEEMDSTDSSTTVVKTIQTVTTTAVSAPTETSTEAAAATAQLQLPLLPIELKSETKEEPDENMVAVDETDKNVTICHDVNEQTPPIIKDEIKTEASDVQPMEH